MSTSTHLIIILSDSDVEDAFSSIDYTPASPDYSPDSPRNTSSDSKTESNPSEDLSKDRSAPLAITPFPDDLYMQIRRAYYVTNEESFDSLSLSTIPPPPAPVCPCRKTRLLQPYEPEPFMQPFRYHPNGMTFIHMAWKRVRAPQAHIASPPVLPSPLVIEYGIKGLVDGRIKHNEEIVLTCVRISTLEILIEDIQVTMALLPPGFLEPLYPDIMAMINAQDTEHITPPTLPRDTDPPIGSPIPLSSSLSVGSSSPVRSTTPPPDYPFDESIFVELDNSLWIIPRPLGNELVPEEPNKSDACLSAHLWKMAPKRKLTSTASAMTQASIRKLVADSVAAALEAQAATMANADNTNRNT
ncbi:hypothetical protein Tco_0415064 [Tanacetum coccineum]